jgi:hypothetical protein
MSRDLPALEILLELLVLVTDELDQFRVEKNALIHTNGPRSRVGFRIVNGDVDLERPVIRPSKTLGQRCGIGERVADDVEPAAVLEPGRFDDERVAIPAADRVAVPPRLRSRSGSLRPSMKM